MVSPIVRSPAVRNTRFQEMRLMTTSLDSGDRPAPAHPRYPPATIFYRLAGIALAAPLTVLYRPRVRGTERLPAGGFVLCANQLSNMDTVALPVSLLPRPVRAMGKAELWKPPLGQLLTALGGFPVRRGQVDVAAIENAVAAARAGHGVLVFPEGTRRSKGLHKTHRSKPHEGPALIALLAGVPVVPAAIRGTEALSRLRRWRIEYGEPIDPTAFAALPRRVARKELTRVLWQRITELEAGLEAEAR